jgi:hypothetical protein
MLPREIQAENWPDRATFKFPPRPIGALRYLGLAPIGFAVLFAWMPGTQVWRALSHLLQGQANTGDLIFGLFTLLFVFAALMPFSVGLFILMGRTRLVVTRDRLVATEIAGPFRWSRRLKVADIERLEVATGMGAKPQSTPPPLSLAKLGGMAAALRDGKHRILLLGYPRDWVEAMAEELSSRMRLHGSPVQIERKEVFAAVSKSAARQEILTQPAGSNARLTESASGFELSVPSRGLRKESGGLLFFAIVWCLFMTLFTGAMLFGKSSGGGDLGRLGGILFVLGFWAIGIGMLLLSIHLGTGRWILSVRGSELNVELRSALRSRSWRWNGSEVRDISVGNSGVEVNDRPLKEIQIYPRSGKKVGLLRGRPDDELAWMASLFRRALRLTPPEPLPESEASAGAP